MLPCTGDKYSFDFNNAWLDSKHGLSKSAAPSSFVPGTHIAMDSAPEGQANYTVDLATGSTQEGWLREGAVLINIFGTGGQTGVCAAGVSLRNVIRSSCEVLSRFQPGVPLVL